MRRRRQGRHLAASVIELAGRPERAAVERAAERLVRRHPLLHARVARSWRDFRARWHPSPPRPLPVHWHKETPPDDPAAGIAALLEESPIDILAEGPNLEFHLFAGDPDRSRLVLIWPHALFDAIGIDKLLDELDAGDGASREDWGETSRVDGSPAELWQAARPMVEEMRTFPASTIRSPGRRDRPAGAARFELIRFDRERTAVIRRHMADRAGELLVLPYFAALAARAALAVLRRRHPADPGAVLLSLPVQRVANPSRRPLFQNHMTAWSLLLPPEELDEPGAAARAVYTRYSSFLRRGLPAAMEALMRLNERCPSRLYLGPASYFLRGEICTLFHSHTGSFPSRARTLFGLPIRNACHLPTVSSPPGFGLFFSEFDGQLSATLSWREGGLERDELALLRTTLLTDLGVAREAEEPTEARA